MIACRTPSSPRHHLQHDHGHQHHHRNSSDSSSMLIMMDCGDAADCNVSVLSFSGTNAPQQQQQRQRCVGSNRRLGASPRTPTMSSFTTATTSPPPPSSPAPTSSAIPSLSTPSTHSQRSSSSSKSKNVRVNVGGESFSFSQTAFHQRFVGLPWKTDQHGVFHLSSNSPAVFEVLLDYVLFGTLPAYDTLCHQEFQEFETMALSMMSSGPQQQQQQEHDLVRLIEHFNRKDSSLNKELRQRRGRRGAAPSNSMTTPPSKSNYFMLNAENASTMSSPNSMAATNCARFLGAICGVGRRPLAMSGNNNTARAQSSQDATAKRLKLTHGERCSSSKNMS